MVQRKSKSFQNVLESLSEKEQVKVIEKTTKYLLDEETYSTSENVYESKLSTGFLLFLKKIVVQKNFKLLAKTIVETSNDLFLKWLSKN